MIVDGNEIFAALTAWAEQRAALTQSGLLSHDALNAVEAQHATLWDSAWMTEQLERESARSDSGPPPILERLVAALSQAPRPGPLAPSAQAAG